MEISRLFIFTIIGVVGTQYSQSYDAAIFLLIYTIINFVALPFLGKVSNNQNTVYQHG
jgi:1,4-dihydroxy-2-naphthoate octaprenyltransferase